MKRDENEKREERSGSDIMKERERVEKCRKTKKIRQTNYLLTIRKIPVGRIIPSEVQNLIRVFNYLHDSNSMFRSASFKSKLIFGRIVQASYHLFCRWWCSLFVKFLLKRRRARGLSTSFGFPKWEYAVSASVPLSDGLVFTPPFRFSASGLLGALSSISPLGERDRERKQRREEKRREEKRREEKRREEKRGEERRGEERRGEDEREDKEIKRK